jgi:hypothetical protein
MKSKIGILLLLAVLYGCSEIFQPKIDTVEPFLVVEGFVTTKFGSNYVYLNKSRGYNEQPYYEGQSGAIVTVTDDQGFVYSYQDMGSGIYRLIPDDVNTISVGRTYTLDITTSDGNRFVSTPQTIVPSPPLKNLLCNYSEETYLTEDAYGQPMEVTYGGTRIIAGTDGILPSDNFYLYAWRAYEEHYTQISYGNAPVTYYDTYRHRQLSGKYVNVIRTANADEYEEFRLRNKEIVFISLKDMQNYLPIYPDTFDFVSTSFQGLLFSLRQQSISAEAYRFYSDIESQLSAEGHLFDPISPQITGNIRCTNDESVKVTGIFYAADISERYSYFYLDSRNRTYSMDIDSFPVLWLDTCSWGLPADWILPPFK